MASNRNSSSTPSSPAEEKTTAPADVEAPATEAAPAEAPAAEAPAETETEGAAPADPTPSGGATPPQDPPVVNTAGDPDRDPVVLGYRETVDESTFIADAHTQSFVEITRDVVEDFYYPGTKRPAQRIVFTKGQVVPRSQVEAYIASGQIN